jgi:hypothetical protein
MPPGFSTRTISSTAAWAPVSPPKCSIDESEYDVECAAAESEVAAVHLQKISRSSRYGNGA